MRAAVQLTGAPPAAPAAAPPAAHALPRRLPRQCAHVTAYDGSAAGAGPAGARAGRAGAARVWAVDRLRVALQGAPSPRPRRAHCAPAACASSPPALDLRAPRDRPCRLTRAPRAPRRPSWTTLRRRMRSCWPRRASSGWSPSTRSGASAAARRAPDIAAAARPALSPAALLSAARLGGEADKHGGAGRAACP